MQHAMLSPAERAVLEALNAEGTRWHKADRIAVAINQPYGVVQSALQSLRRRACAAKRTTMGWTHEWAITDIGHQALNGHEQLRLA